MVLAEIQIGHLQNINKKCYDPAGSVHKIFEFELWNEYST